MASQDDLLDAARAQTGLDDFGDDSFREGLEVLVRSLRDEARLNDLGEAVIYGRLTGHLAQRLQIEDWYRRHPEIDEVPIEAPLVQLGLPRTGSTALGFLLAKDPNVRFLRQWESSEPAPPPATVEGPDPRIERAIQMLEGSSQVVPSDVHGPMECLDLLALDFKTQMYHAFARIPTYAAWVNDEADLTSTYAYERRALKLLQWQEPVRPWRLRSPAHILWLDALDHVFPDARFVMTHRDPTDVLLSVCDVYAEVGRMFTDEPDPGHIGRLNADQWATGMDRAVAFRDAGNDHRFYDIDFRTMQGDPIGQVRGLYDWLGEDVTPEFESAMTAWWKHNTESHEAAKHSAPEVYGLDLDAIRPRFAEYVKRAAAWTDHGTTTRDGDA
jgi:hypothetical protein